MFSGIWLSANAIASRRPEVASTCDFVRSMIANIRPTDADTLSFLMSSKSTSLSGDVIVHTTLPSSISVSASLICTPFCISSYTKSFTMRCANPRSLAVSDLSISAAASVTLTTVRIVGSPTSFLYSGSLASSAIAYARRCRKPGSIAVPPQSTMLRASRFRASTGHAMSASRMALGMEEASPSPTPSKRESHAVNRSLGSSLIDSVRPKIGYVRTGTFVAAGSLPAMHARTLMSSRASSVGSSHCSVRCALI
mmetsp:Transcript_35733/g.93420  ORF Transcript_35733/g.93420 Transcript_35733/m.93420 type:complete len:253 (-) Transcript_35733:764-1522(-)